MLPFVRHFDRGLYILEISRDKAGNTYKRHLPKPHIRGQEAEITSKVQIVDLRTPKSASRIQAINKNLEIANAQQAVIDAKQRQRQAASNRADCVYLLEATGDSVRLIGCGGCGMDRTTIFDCQLFGDCAPLARGEIVQDANPQFHVRDCRLCSEYRSKTLKYSRPALGMQEQPDLYPARAKRDRTG